VIAVEDEDLSRRWDDFLRLDRMRDHWWWRPGWRLGRSFYTFHITFDEDPAVRRLAATYHAALDLPTLDPVPLDGLHMTLQGVGFTDEVTDDEIAAITVDATRRCTAPRPFAVTIGPADGDPQGVPLAVRPWEPIRQLRSVLRDAISAVWGPDRVPEDAEDFRPHVTVFYSNADADPSPLRQALAALRSTPPVQASISSVSLIRLNRDQKTYKWTTAASIPLGS
jgi:2'-5' RNA ligase